MLLHLNDLGLCLGSVADVSNTGTRIPISAESRFWFGLVWFNGISNIVGYLMPNPLYTYILNIYDFVWLVFMAYQPL